MVDAPSRWPQFAWALRKQALMDEMMEAQGVDPLAAVKTGEAFVRARANCRDCDCEGACRDWFLDGESEQADFCPNEEFFAALKREK
jgi:hypothetical protein